MARIDAYNPHVQAIGDNRHEPISIVAPPFPHTLREPQNVKAEYEHPQYRRKRFLERAREQLNGLGGRR